MTRSINDPLSAAEIIRFMEEVGVSIACPRCGTNSWTYVDEAETGDSISWQIQTSKDGQMRNTGRFIPVVVALCSNCSFISSHAKANVIFKLNEMDDGAKY